MYERVAKGIGLIDDIDAKTSSITVQLLVLQVLL